MADVSKVKINKSTYDIKDETARTDLATKAPLASPALTGTPTAPTATSGTSTTQIATTAFAKGEADKKISKSGDTMTGDYAIKNLSMDSTITPVGDNVLSNLRFKDKNDVTVGVLRSGVNTTGRVTTDIMTHRIVNNTDYYNSLSICLNDDGTPYVYIQHTDAWLNALGLSDSGWQSITNSDAFTGTLNYRKIGPILCVKNTTWIYLKNSLAANSSVELCTLPSGYRPPATAGFAYTPSNFNVFPVKIESGAIRLYNNMSSAINTTSAILFNMTTMLL